MDAEYVHAVLDPEADVRGAELLLARMRTHLGDGSVQLSVRLPDDRLNPWPGQLFLVMRPAAGRR